MRNFTKQDGITMLLLTFLGLAMSFLIYMPSRQSGDFLEIRINGNVAGQYPLSVDCTETITTDAGSNTFYIRDGIVFMEDADCHDRICVSMNGISRQGQTIVCLPHKLVLAIVSKNSSPYDAVTGGAS